MLQLKKIKHYQSPLFIVAAFILLYGVYLYFDHKAHPQNWSGLMSLVAFFYGGAGMILHFILWVFLNKKPKALLLAEIIILVAAFITVLIANR